MSHYSGRHRAPHAPSTLMRGAVGATTVAAVGLALPVAMAPTAGAHTVTNPTKFNANVRVGDSGEIVKTIQRKVGAPVTGKYLYKTYYAVKRYQRAHGFKDTGTVNPWTGRHMRLPSNYKTQTKKKATSSTTSAASRGAAIVKTASKYYGTPYRYGGTTTAGFDCSGFTGHVLKQHGKKLPRTAEQQRKAAFKPAKRQKGDLVFFGKPAYHVGIYAGNNQIIDAGRSGSTVSKRKIWTSDVTYGRF